MKPRRWSLEHQLKRVASAYCCPYCPKICLNAKRLRNHVRNEHPLKPGGRMCWNSTATNATE